MQIPNVFKAMVVTAALPQLASARHIANGSKINFNASAPDGVLQKRFDDERFTYYDITTGPTACGNYYSPSDYVVALDASQFGDGSSFPGPNCFKEITISANGKTTNAQIVDECPGCPYGGLDLTEGLFEFFAPLDVGVLTGSWSFI